MAELAAVVLAGGASRRMGRDKAVMPHPRRPTMTMLEHTISVLGDRCAPVLVVAAPGQVLPGLGDGAEVLRDELPGLGPLPATARGLRAAADAGAEWAFVSAVDMPNLSADLIDRLVGLPADRREAEVVVPWDGRDHYLAGIYRTSLAERIDVLAGAGEGRMRALADTVRTHRVAIADTSILLNANSPADLDG